MQWTKNKNTSQGFQILNTRLNLIKLIRKFSIKITLDLWPNLTVGISEKLCKIFNLDGDIDAKRGSCLCVLGHAFQDCNEWMFDLKQNEFRILSFFLKLLQKNWEKSMAKYHAVQWNSTEVYLGISKTFPEAWIRKTFWSRRSMIKCAELVY